MGLGLKPKLRAGRLLKRFLRHFHGFHCRESAGLGWPVGLECGTLRDKIRSIFL